MGTFQYASSLDLICVVVIFIFELHYGKFACGTLDRVVIVVNFYVCVLTNAESIFQIGVIGR